MKKQSKQFFIVFCLKNGKKIIQKYFFANSEYRKTLFLDQEIDQKADVWNKKWIVCLFEIIGWITWRVLV